MKGTQEGFLSRQIARPQATDFGCEPKSGRPGNCVAGTTQEGFLLRAIARPYPKGISSPLRGSDTGNKLRPSAEIFLSLSKNQTVFRQAEAPVPGAVTSASALPVEIVTAFISDLEKFS